MGLNVLIVDDHAGFRASARRLLECDGWVVVAEAADGAEAVACTEQLCPDVVLLDVHLPDCDGRDLARRLEVNGYRPTIVLISSRELDDFGEAVDRAGAAGFISKDELSGAALRALVG